MCSQYPPHSRFPKGMSNNRISAYYRRDKLKTQILADGFLLALKLASEVLDPKCISLSIIAYRIISLNKKRIIGETIAWVLKKGHTRSCGTPYKQQQFCREAQRQLAIHATRITFEQEDTKVIVLVDASNAFNSSQKASCTT